MWSSRGGTVPANTLNVPTLNLIRAEGTHDGNDGYIAADMTNIGLVTGICQYQGTIYISALGGTVTTVPSVHKITAINWATDAITTVPIASSNNLDIQGLFTFKDRLWGWNGAKLYFTDLPANAGAFPEAWAAAANVINFVGPNGAGKIKSVVPLSNRLCVFTNNGLFTLLVEGAPASWIMRVLDSKSISTTSQTAFETKGIIYFVNTNGVWATNSLSITKISMVIDDQWFQAKGQRIHMINEYEDGISVSVARLIPGTISFDRDSSQTFYTKLDPIGWTEWNINPYSMPARPERMVGVWSTTDKIPTYVNPEPTVYTNLWVTDSAVGNPQLSVLQLLIFDGGKDIYSDRQGTTRTIPVGILLKTKLFDGGNQYNKKFAKKGMLEVFSSSGLVNQKHIFTTSWDIDVTIDASTEKRTTPLDDFVVGVGSNLIQVPALYWYRRAAFNLRANLQDDSSQIKIKDITLAQNTGRGAFELVE
jgi:uncharacterized protein (UPF0333 family)